MTTIEEKAKCYSTPQGIHGFECQKVDKRGKLIEQKPVGWSEEDEHRITSTIYFLETAKRHYASTVELDACISWLELLKKRLSLKNEDINKCKPTYIPRFHKGDKVINTNNTRLTYDILDVIGELDYKVKVYIDGKLFASDTRFISCKMMDEWGILYKNHIDSELKVVMDKVEPRFHKDEWIITKANNLYKITAIIDDKYQLKYGDNYTVQKCADVDKNARLWTIQDAKPGDVLHSIGFHSDFIFIFNGLDNWKFDEPDGERAVATGYCCLTLSADNMEFGIQGPDCIEVDTVKPATNKQRDLLFQKMKEASYEFDFEKKELKTIEQSKLTDKVGSKLNVGDWLVHNERRNIVKVVGYTPLDYEVVDTLGYHHKITSDAVENNYHLWSIKDAKDGDVLACNEEILLFKSYSVQGRISLYCWYNEHTNNFHSKGVVDVLMTTRNKIYPATKEQRDTLEMAITNAGYEWDADEKELRLIEYNGKDYGIDSLYHAQRILEKTLGKVDGYQTDDGILEHKCAITLVKRLYEHKPNEWSEEDSARLQRIADFLWKNRKGDTDTIYQQEQDANWLKSLESKCGYNPYKAVVESIAKMCDKYEAFASDEAQMRDFLCNVRAKCHEAVEYDKKYCQN